MMSNTERIMQIDCNNPNIDFAVVATFGDDDESVVTTAGANISADEKDEVPFSCPLTQEKGEGRKVEDFARACGDCTHSFISDILGRVSVDG